MNLNKNLYSMKFFFALIFLLTSSCTNKMDIEKFKESNIDIIWHNYIHPKYKQMHGKFEKNLSIIDCMFNIGIDQTNKLLKQK